METILITVNVLLRGHCFPQEFTFVTQLTTIYSASKTLYIWYDLKVFSKLVTYDNE